MITIKDLSATTELDVEAMSEVRGGMFGALIRALSSYSSSSDNSADPSPSFSDITVTKSTDISSPSLF